MTARAEFLAALRAGLRGAPRSLVDEAIADYSAHFQEGAGMGRSDAEIAQALGDPLALAEELRAEADVKGWERCATPRSGWRVLAQAIGRGAMHVSVAFMVLPLLGVTALLLVFTSLTALGGGLWFLFAGHAFDLPGGATTVLLAGTGLFAGGISLAGLTLLGASAAINLLARLTRSGFRHLHKSGTST